MCTTDITIWTYNTHLFGGVIWHPQRTAVPGFRSQCAVPPQNVNRCRTTFSANAPLNS